jgi:hypothetical protein
VRNRDIEDHKVMENDSNIVVVIVQEIDGEDMGIARKTIPQTDIAFDLDKERRTDEMMGVNNAAFQIPSLELLKTTIQNT